MEKKPVDNSGLRLGIIVQARVGSTRLPGKVLLDFHQGRGILDLVLEKFNTPAFAGFKRVLATSTAPGDQALGAYAKKYGYLFFQGSEENVLQRFIQAAEENGFSHVIRVCADNPLLNAGSTKDLIAALKAGYEAGHALDYVSYKTSTGIPVIKSHLGLFTEIVSLDALKQTAARTSDPLYHEHVTNYIYADGHGFNVQLLPAPDAVYDRADLRFTIDDQDDFETIARLYSHTAAFAEDLDKLVDFVDTNEQSGYKRTMIDNIKKYTK